MEPQPDGSAFMLFAASATVLFALIIWVAWSIRKADNAWELLHEGVVGAVRDSIAPASLRPRSGGLPTIPVEEKVLTFSDGKTLRVPRLALDDSNGLLREGEYVSIWVNGNGKFSVRV